MPTRIAALFIKAAGSKLMCSAAGVSIMSTTVRAPTVARPPDDLSREVSRHMRDPCRSS